MSATCLYCNKESASLVCQVCFSQITPVINAKKDLKSYGVYEGVLKDLIHQFKYENKFGLAEPFAICLKDFVPEYIDFIVPIPLHFNKLKQRKYNQTVFMAKRLSALIQKPCLINNLKKTVDTPSQMGLSKNERKENVRGVFLVREPQRINQKNILLLDDVYTTGATTAEAKKVLKAAGAKTVTTLTLAKSLS